MAKLRFAILALLFAHASAPARSAQPFDAASAFGARVSVSRLNLSPDGTKVAYIVPAQGQGSVAYTLSLEKGAVRKPAMSADGKPYRLQWCHWVSNERLVCTVSALLNDPDYGLMPVSRILAVNADGSNARVLSVRSKPFMRGMLLDGGDVIDWLPDEEGAVLMTHAYLPDDHLGTRLGSSEEGLGVDWLDTRTLAIKHVEPAHREAYGYLTDGRGTVRIMATRTTRSAGYDTGIITYLYRLPGAHDWRTLGNFNVVDGSGFDPYAVDRDRNVVYGFKKKDGRKALYAVTLDESRHEELIYSRPDVEVDDLITIGRRSHVVGTSYALETRNAEFFAPEIASLVGMLSKAVPQHALQVTDASVDENKLVVFAESDTDPGVYYIFDRQSKHLDTFLVSRGELEGVALAAVKPITYPAADGVAVPAYLTLPPGQKSAKGLPAIVMPHGGPSARDEWGFAWLAQFYAARGFAVLQPNYRGSTGYGDNWFVKNGFRSWPIAISDVLDAGRWLVHEGIADPSKLAIVGWSYGGYAALQSAVVDPSVFKAVVAIAPVTDLPALKEEHRFWSDFDLVSQFVGEGSHMHEGSPLEHADKIKVPVLLFHGAFDRNVSIGQSKRMAARLTAAGAKCELVTWDDLDHQLEDSNARAELLRKSDAFLRQALGM